MDKLIEYINNNSEELGIRAQYSTLSDYFDAVKQTNQTWTVRDFDFFPYIDNDQRYILLKHYHNRTLILYF